MLAIVVALFFVPDHDARWLAAALVGLPRGTAPRALEVAWSGAAGRAGRARGGRARSGARPPGGSAGVVLVGEDAVERLARVLQHLRRLLDLRRVAGLRDLHRRAADALHQLAELAHLAAYA